MLTRIKQLFSRHETDRRTVEGRAEYYKRKFKEADDRKQMIDIVVDLLEPYRKINSRQEKRIIALEQAVLAKSKTRAQS